MTLNAFAAEPILIRLEEWLTAAGIVIFFMLLALAVRFFFRTIVLLFTRRTRTQLDDMLAKALVSPIVVALIVLGFYLGIVRLPLEQFAASYNSVFIIATIALATMTVIRVGNALVTWYAEEVAHRTATNFDDRLLPVMRRVGSVIIWGIGLMIILDQAHVNISPLIASLGIGGLAIAIAVQPTLSNFMAGTYVISDSVIRKGHYIVLDTGQEGEVEEIGWRTTKIKHWQGNIIVLPNSKLAEAIVTDLQAREITKVFRVECGVSYGSDLEKVEKVTLEAARDVLKHSSAGVKDFEPAVRFKEFGDSNIIFAVVLKSADRLSQFQLKHEFIKALHKRFAQEGITIEFPARRLYLARDEGQAPDGFPPRIT